ncbi:MAG: ATP-dependent Clp protease proteolytic subunit [Elusimicrobia bacterium]|nr:ATP-dependent Clp protease proteolytic subunit [Elusimicrobiota bacterium]
MSRLSLALAALIAGPACAQAPAPLKKAVVLGDPAPVASTSAAPAPGPAPASSSPERQELDRIMALNSIEQQKMVSRLRPVSDEREEAAARYALLFEKQRLELAELDGRLKRFQLETGVQDEAFRKEAADLRRQRDRLKLENEIARERLAAEQIKIDAEKFRTEAAMRALELESRKLRLTAELAGHKTVALTADLELRSKKEDWKKEANRDAEYPREPFRDGVLTISDRRIALNGPIVTGTADHVTERIHYFNNKDESLPIFIVIDWCPCGSVMEAYRILKAMAASKAPVHVVVKSFAASMAAVITALAPRSYAYPNAIILHHQVQSGTWGNLTQMKETVEIVKEWYQRFAEPVARKMGLTLDQFTAQMYKHNSDGDWQEFADVAVSRRWVDRVVHEVRETGILKEPEDKSAEPPRGAFGLTEATDAQGRRFMRLPRLQPFDAYWIYNRDDYYR